MSELQEQLEKLTDTATARMAEYRQMREALCSADAMLQKMESALIDAGVPRPNGYAECFRKVRNAVVATD